MLISTTEAAARTGWSAARIRKLCKAGVIKCADLKGVTSRIEIYEESLNELLNPSNAKSSEPKQKQTARRSRIDADVEHVF